MDHVRCRAPAAPGPASSRFAHRCGSARGPPGRKVRPRRATPERLALRPGPRPPRPVRTPARGENPSSVDQACPTAWRPAREWTLQGRHPRTFAGQVRKRRLAVVRSTAKRAKRASPCARRGGRTGHRLVGDPPARSPPRSGRAILSGYASRSIPATTGPPRAPWPARPAGPEPWRARAATSPAAPGRPQHVAAGFLVDWRPPRRQISPGTPAAHALIASAPFASISKHRSGAIIPDRVRLLCPPVRQRKRTPARFTSSRPRSDCGSPRGYGSPAGASRPSEKQGHARIVRRQNERAGGTGSAGVGRRATQQKRSTRSESLSGGIGETWQFGPPKGEHTPRRRGSGRRPFRVAARAGASVRQFHRRAARGHHRR